MVATHGRPWISFYRPLPVPSTLQRSNDPFFAHPLRKCALKPRFWFRWKKEKIIVDDLHLFRYLLIQQSIKKNARNLGFINFFSPSHVNFFNIFSSDFDFENFFHFLLRKNFLISEIPTFNEGEREREREKPGIG